MIIGVVVMAVVIVIVTVDLSGPNHSLMVMAIKLIITLVFITFCIFFKMRQINNY